MLNNSPDLPPTTTPMSDQFIAVNSDDNVTYNCTVEAGSTVVWEVERSQIRSEDQFNDILASGYIIEPMDTESTDSTISISSMARVNNSEILVQCLASQGITSTKGETYLVVTFGE